MTDNEITREKTFSEELPYFKEQIKEVFDNYHNTDGSEDPLYIAVLRDSHRIVRKAEVEINRQKSEIERLKGSVIVNNIMESQKIKREAKFEAIKEFAEKLKLHSYIMSDESQTGIINRYSVVTVNQIDNILKELVGNER